MQLASRLEELTRIKVEKAAEAAALRADPLGTAIDTTQEARARLAALRQQEQQQKQAKPAAAAAAAADSDGEQQQQQAASGSGRGAAAAEAAGDDDAAAAADEEAYAAGDGEGGGGGDPYAGMNARQRKLYELKQKMQQARKANENAIIAERKRQRVSSSRHLIGVAVAAGCEMCMHWKGPKCSCLCYTCIQQVCMPFSSHLRHYWCCCLSVVSRALWQG
jgi:hypothetical protein